MPLLYLISLQPHTARIYFRVLTAINNCKSGRLPATALITNQKPTSYFFFSYSFSQLFLRVRTFIRRKLDDSISYTSSHKALCIITVFVGEIAHTGVNESIMENVLNVNMKTKNELSIPTHTYLRYNIIVSSYCICIQYSHFYKYFKVQCSKLFSTIKIIPDYDYIKYNLNTNSISRQ